MAEALDCAAGAANNSLVNECSDSQGPRGPKFLRGSLKVNKTKTSVIVVLAAFMLPFVVAHGAGGRIEGKVTDPKGAVVIGAAITVTDPISNQTFAAITDNDGHYKVEGLPPGTYAVTVSAKGFTDGRRDEVKIEEGATLNLDVKLEIAPVEAAVNVAASGVKANADPVYQQLRQLGKNEKELTEQFSHLVLRFTDKTVAEVKASANAKIGTGGPQAEKAVDLYRDNQHLLRKQLRDNAELRTLADIYAPQRPGYFSAFIAGKKHGKLVFLLDPLGIPQLSPEEIALFSYGETDGGIWTAFHLADEYSKGTAASSEDHRLFDITHHEIDGAIHGTQLTASDRVTFRPLVAGRLMAFSLYRSLRVSRVRDEQGKDLSFVQESKDEDANFTVIMPRTLEVGKSYTLTVEYSGGNALRDSGGGNFILLPRSTWYPNNGGTQFGDRATFDITMRYPRSNLFVATGAPVEPDKQDGNVMWPSGRAEKLSWR